MGCTNTCVKTLKDIKESTDPISISCLFKNSFDHMFYSFKLVVFIIQYNWWSSYYCDDWV